MDGRKWVRWIAAGAGALIAVAACSSGSHKAKRATPTDVTALGPLVPSLGATTTPGTGAGITTTSSTTTIPAHGFAAPAAGHIATPTMPAPWFVIGSTDTLLCATWHAVAQSVSCDRIIGSHDLTFSDGKDELDVTVYMPDKPSARSLDDLATDNVGTNNSGDATPTTFDGQPARKVGDSAVLWQANPATFVAVDTSQCPGCNTLAVARTVTLTAGLAPEDLRYIVARGTAAGTGTSSQEWIAYAHLASTQSLGCVTAVEIDPASSDEVSTDIDADGDEGPCSRTLDDTGFDLNDDGTVIYGEVTDAAAQIVLTGGGTTQVVHPVAFNVGGARPLVVVSPVGGTVSITAKRADGTTIGTWDDTSGTPGTTYRPAYPTTPTTYHYLTVPTTAYSVG